MIRSFPSIAAALVAAAATAAPLAAVFAQDKTPAGAAQVAAAPASSAAADKSGDSSFDPSLADKGKRTYTQNCARCHGINMVSTGAGFFDLRTFPANEKPRFLDSVKNGKRAMPAWKESLKDDEIESIWAYVVTAKPKAKP